MQALRHRPARQVIREAVQRRLQQHLIRAAPVRVRHPVPAVRYRQQLLIREAAVRHRPAQHLIREAVPQRRPAQALEIFHPEDRPEAETEAALLPAPDQCQHRDSKCGIVRNMRKQDEDRKSAVWKLPVFGLFSIYF